MDNWDEVRTAYQVARLGTVSGAADVLGVHHATVIRHIDALEARLGAKLFQRHPRGYTATEAGLDLLRVATATDDQLSQLAGRIRGNEAQVSGDLVVTSLRSMVPIMAPLLAAFQCQHPDVMIRYLTGDRLFRLEYGEAHVAIRAGVAPDQPDNVVQALPALEMALYASAAYVAERGVPAGPQDYPTHRFIGPEDTESRAPHAQWLADAVPARAVTFRCNDTRSTLAAVRAGAGIGFLTTAEAAGVGDLVEVQSARPEWSAPMWLVTHVDLHRTNKVQALLTFIKERTKDGLS